MVKLLVPIFILVFVLNNFGAAGSYDFEGQQFPNQNFISLIGGSGTLSRGNTNQYSTASIIGMGGALEFGQRSLSPFDSPTANTPYIFTVAYEPITSFSVDMGDFAGDIDTLTIRAYAGGGGTGTLLATATATLENVNPTFNFKILKVEAAGIRSVVFIGGSATLPNSVYYDNFKTTVAPNGTMFGRLQDLSAVADFTVYRPSSGIWFTYFSFGDTPPFQAVSFGATNDKPASGDYNGDHVWDIAVFRNGVWYIRFSRTNISDEISYKTIQFGDVSDIPVPADYDNDGITDIAVFRPSNGSWYILRSSDNQFTAAQFGQAGDIPVQGYYDGDGRADIAVFRPSNGVWYLLQSSAGFNGVQFGINTDKPVPADYDGDGKTDVAVYRDGTWYLRRSQLGLRTVSFGAASDLPVPAEYVRPSEFSNPTGRAGIAVWRPSNGTFYILDSNNQFYARQWGQQGDIPISLVNN